MRKCITTAIVTDALGILATKSLEGNLYLFDDNRRSGSYGEGTSGMVTVLDFKEQKPEDYELAWFIMNLRPDVSVEIADMQAGSDAVLIERHVYEETSISCWVARVRRAFDTVECTLSLRILGYPKMFTHRITIKGRGQEHE